MRQVCNLTYLGERFGEGAVDMTIYELKSDQIIEVPKTTFSNEGVKERSDLQRLLRARIDVVSPNTLVIAEEFGHWQDSKRRIDLLGLDKDANLVVIELKRSEDGGHMELQSLRYAAMVSTMTFEQVVAARDEFRTHRKIETDAEQSILDFLGWEEANEDQFAQSVRIVLVSADFSKELTTAVMWLNAHDLDIRCVRMKPYSLEGRVLLDVQQVIPLPEAAEYQVQIKEKAQEERKAKKNGNDYTKYDVSVLGEVYKSQWKRRAILLVVKALVGEGISPEQIAELIHRPFHKTWWSLDNIESEDFVKQASRATESNQSGFNEIKWFCGADELLNFKGRTYAFSNQWGKSWPKAMTLLAEAFPEHRISFAAEGGSHTVEDVHHLT